MKNLFAALLLCLGSVAATAAVVLQTASQVGIPFKFDLKNPDRPGVCVEILRALQRVDPELQFPGLERELPLKRIEAELATGQLDVFFALIRTPERVAARVAFLDTPVLYAVRHQVAVRANDPIQVSTLEDIRRLGREGGILTTQGTAYPQFLDDHQGLVVDTSSGNNGQILRMLLAGRGRFFYQGDSTLRAQIAADGLRGQVRVLPAVFKTDEQLVAVNPNLPREKRERLQRALDAIERSGELTRLRVRYGLY